MADMPGDPRASDGAARARMLAIGGRSGVGKTSVAMALHDALMRAEVAHCLIDGDALDAAWPPPWEQDPDFDLANLSSLWERYRALGHTRIVYFNTIAVLRLDALAAATGAAVTGALLRCSDDTAFARLGGRESGPSLEDHLARSRKAAEQLDREAPSEVLRVDTGCLSPDDVARVLGEHLGWLS